MDLSWTTWVFQYANIQSVVLFALLLGLYSVLKKHNNGIAPLPPGPRGWPIVGNLLSLTLHSERDMLKWNKEYGPVCRLKMASLEFIILGSQEAVEEAFVKKGEIFSDRLQNSIPGLSGKTGIVFRNYNTQLKEQRRFGLATLKEFGMGRRSIEPRILEECSELCQEIETHCRQREAFAVDFMIYQTISSVVSQLIFGKNLPKENDEFREFLRLVMTGTKYSAINGIAVFYPGLRKLPPFSWGFQESILHEVNTFRMIQEQIEDHKKTRDLREPRDFIDCFLNEMDAIDETTQNSNARGFTDEQLNNTVRDLFLAGSETTSTTICWTILYLCRHQDIQAKLHREINDVLGTSKHPSVALANQLPYAKSVIQETLRARPLVPIGVPHVAKEEGSIMGYRIPKGAVIASNIFRIHNDENLWPDPEKFNPSRHLDPEGGFLKSPNIIPFSIGARQCLGFQLANMELFLVVVSLFQRFSFELAPGQDIDMRGKNIFTLRPYPFQVLAKLR